MATWSDSMRRKLVTAITTLALLGLAAPASADHFIEATESGCYGGAIATGFGRSLGTDDVRIQHKKSGETVWTCTFEYVGTSSEEENNYFDYVVPTESVKRTSIDGCWETDENAAPVRVADAEIHYRPNGSVRITCTLPAL